MSWGWGAAPRQARVLKTPGMFRDGDFICHPEVFMPSPPRLCHPSPSQGPSFSAPLRVLPALTVPRAFGHLIPRPVPVPAGMYLGREPCSLIEERNCGGFEVQGLQTI